MSGKASRAHVGKDVDSQARHGQPNARERTSHTTRRRVEQRAAGHVGHAPLVTVREAGRVRSMPAGAATTHQNSKLHRAPIW